MCRRIDVSPWVSSSVREVVLWTLIQKKYLTNDAAKLVPGKSIFLHANGKGGIVTI